jgi:hypothetical protein
MEAYTIEAGVHKGLISLYYLLSGHLNGRSCFH